MLEIDLVAYLQAQPSIANIVGTRIFPVVIPEGTNAPSLIYETVSAIPTYTFDGSVGLVTARITFTAWSPDFSDCKTMQEAIRVALDNYPPSLMGSTPISAIWRDNGCRDGWDSISSFYRSSADYRISYAEQ